MIKKFFQLLRKLFWDEPTKVKKEKKAPVPASEVTHDYVIIQYKNRDIQLRNHEVPMFESMLARDKEEMVKNFQRLVKKHKLVLQEIDGKKIYARTRGYDYSKHFVK